MKIFKGTEAYKGGKNAPILLMGDSFTGVFESVDQKSGGPGSLLAYATGLDVQVLTSWGGGPGVYHRMMKMKKDMQSKRLVIYMMTARDFWQSPMEWDGL
jgi:alginate O-acetyltransferase complex protein AlgJ